MHRIRQVRSADAAEDLAYLFNSNTLIEVGISNFNACNGLQGIGRCDRWIRRLGNSTTNDQHSCASSDCRRNRCWAQATSAHHWNVNCTGHGLQGFKARHTFHLLVDRRMHAD